LANVVCSESRTRRRAIITRFDSSPKPPVSSQTTTPATTEGSLADECTPPATTTHNSPEDGSAKSITDTRPGTLGSIQFTVLYNLEEKKLTVHLIRAKNLKAMDSNGFSDPYVKLHLLPGNAKATKLTSRTIEKTLNPEWNEELHYYGITETDKQKKTLRITVLDRDRIGSDFLGETRIALRKLPINTPKKFNLYLEHAIPIPLTSPRTDANTAVRILPCATSTISSKAHLFVTIKRCAELIGMDSTGFSDPYFRSHLSPSKAHRQRTSIKKRTLNPEFNEDHITFHTFPFKVRYPPKNAIRSAFTRSPPSRPHYDLGKQWMDYSRGGIVLSTAAKDERGKQWSSCIENPGQTFESWHQLELDA
ncbi:C2 domain protein, partial [Cooperia oncophora]